MGRTLQFSSGSAKVLRSYTANELAALYTPADRAALAAGQVLVAHVAEGMEPLTICEPAAIRATSPSSPARRLSAASVSRKPDAAGPHQTQPINPERTRP